MTVSAAKRAYDKKYYLEHIVEIRKYNQNRHKDPVRHAKILARHKMLRMNMRIKVIELYGGKCACCKENFKEFLALDHINGGGMVHRRKISKRKNCDSTTLYRAVLKEGFKPDKYRILCHNCNQSLGSYGYCPHNS